MSKPLITHHALCCSTLPIDSGPNTWLIPRQAPPVGLPERGGGLAIEQQRGSAAVGVPGHRDVVPVVVQPDMTLCGDGSGRRHDECMGWGRGGCRVGAGAPTSAPRPVHQRQMRVEGRVGVLQRPAHPPLGVKVHVGARVAVIGVLVGVDVKRDGTCMDMVCAWARPAWRIRKWWVGTQAWI